VYCPECQSEYRVGIVRCSDCDVALVDELQLERERFGNLLSVAEEKSPEFVAEVLDRLEKAGVPYAIEAGTALAMLGSDDVIFDEPQPWEARVWIPAAFEERAQRILRALDEKAGRRRIDLI
jgi:hypothetical protein